MNESKELPPINALDVYAVPEEPSPEPIKYDPFKSTKTKAQRDANKRQRRNRRDGRRRKR